MKRLATWGALAIWAVALALAIVGTVGPGRPGEGIGATLVIAGTRGAERLARDAGTNDGPAVAQRVTIVLAQGLTLEDLRLLDGWIQWPPGQRAMALLAATTAGWSVAPHAYLTLATGAPAYLPEVTVPPLDRDASWQGEPGSELYERWTGYRAGGSAVLVPAVQEIVHANRDQSPPVRPGVLADTLARAGLSTAIFGHADAVQRGRWAAVIAMDSHGRIPFGTLDGVMRPDPASPNGKALHWPLVVRSWRELPGRVGLVVIESGDLLRLEQVRTLVAPQRLDQLRQQALARLATGVEQLLQAAAALPGRQPVWLIGPAPPRPLEGAPRGFGVIWIWEDGWWAAEASTVGKGMAVPGVLTSASTRRLGIVPLTDLVPAVLDALGIDVATGSSGFIGRPPLTITPALDSRDLWDEARRLESDLLANDRSRVPLIKGYVLTLLVILAGAVLSLRYPALRGVVTGLLPALAAVPLVYLLLPWLGAAGLLGRAAWTLALIVAVSLLASGRDPSAHVLLPLCLATILIVCVDLFTGANGVVRSPLGYSLLSGARYYGIGNEYAGVLLGAAAMAAGLGVERGAWMRREVPRVFVGLLLLAGITAVIVAPAAGANFGCGIASAVATVTFAGVFVVHRLSGQIRGWVWALPLVAAAAFVTIVIGSILWDWWQGAGATHIGRAAALASIGDWQALAGIARRKVLLNWRLIRYTIWSRVLIMSLVAIAIFVLQPAPGFRRIWRDHPGLAAGVSSGIVGALFALVLNDSGVVAAATTMIFPATGLLHALLVPHGSTPLGEDSATVSGKPTRRKAGA